jgi:hypothetical protein
MRNVVALTLLVGGLMLIGATGASAQMWGRSTAPRSGVCFYEDINFGGRWFCARPGADLRDVPLGTNDKISSIRVFGDVEVNVYRDAGFRGRTTVFRSDVRDLRRSDWNDRISSVQVFERGGRGRDSGGFGRDDRGSRDGRSGRGNAVGIEVFGDIKFKGRSAMFNESTPDVRNAGMNGTISSLRVPAGQRWQVCTEANYRGRCQTVSNDVSDLRKGDWNDVIVSLRRVR